MPFVTIFNSVFATPDRAVEVEIDLANMPVFERPADKKLATYMVAGKMKPGATARRLDTVATIELAVVDYDDLNADQLAEVEEMLDTYSYATWSTFSHDPHSPLHRRRFAIALDRPISDAEWKQFAASAKKHFVHCDPACWDMCRLHGMPLRDGTISFHDGAPLSVDSMMRGAIPRPVPQTIRQAELRDFAERLLRKRSSLQKMAGQGIVNALDRAPIAREGERDSTLWQMAKEIANFFPAQDPFAFVPLFSYSIEQFHSPEITVEMLRDKLRRAYDEAGRSRDSTGEASYTPEELAEFGEKPMWIVHKGASYYLFHEGQYEGPLSATEAEVLMPRYLSRASTAGVILHTVTPSGEQKPKPITKLVREYGDVAKEVKIDMTATRSYYNKAERTIVEAPSPMRPLSPQYDEECDKFLQRFRSDALIDWLAVCTDLRRPCAALYLDGPGGIGKSLLARGVARLWSTEGAFTPASAVFGSSFDETLLKNPLVVADEALPPRTSSTVLREFIQSTQRAVRRKYLPDARTEGAVRLMILANNKSALETSEELSEADIAAIAERFVYVSAPRTERFDHPEGFAYINARYLHSEALPRHILWLRDNRDVSHLKSRFFFKDAARPLAVYLAVRTGMRSTLCETLVNHFQQLDGQPLHGFPSLKRLPNGDVEISSYDMKRMIQGTPSIVDVTNALRALSRNKVDEGGVFVVQSEYLNAWCQYTGISLEKERVSKALSM